MAYKGFKGNKDAKGQGFDKNKQNINRRGQPRKGVSYILNELKKGGVEPLTKKQVEDIVLNLMVLEEYELKVLINDAKTPVIIRVCIREIFNNKTGFSAINTLLDRGIGKAMQETQTNITIKDNPLEDLVSKVKK